MERISPYIYGVVKGEAVTVLVTSQGFAPPTAVAAGYQTPLQEQHPANNKVTWSFVVTRDPGQDHRVRLSFVFPQSADATDHFHIHVSGNEGTGFDAPDHYATDGASVGLKFRVRAA